MNRKASPEQLDKIGALAAEMIQPGQRVGLGSGKAALAFVRALGARLQRQRLAITAIPTSVATEKVARDLAIPLTTLDQIDTLDITVDGADEVDPHLNLIKGGGGYLTREKVIASISKRFVIVVGGEKIVPHLGTHFPVFIEVIDFARPVVTRRLQAMGATVTQRTNSDGSPYRTDNGNAYLHVTFHNGGSTLLTDPLALDQSLHHIPGIVETALFIGMAHEVLIAHPDGRIERKVRARE